MGGRGVWAVRVGGVDEVTRYRINEIEKPNGRHCFTVDRLLPFRRVRWTWRGILPRRFVETGEEWMVIRWFAPLLGGPGIPWEFVTREMALAHVKVLEFSDWHGESRVVSVTELP